MKPTVYLETSIIGYVTSRPSRDLVTAANQQLTHEWWDKSRPSYEVYISQYVINECSAGDAVAAAERLSVVGEFSMLSTTEEVEKLAAALVAQIPLPQKADVDALHIAIATVHGIDYLLTWNCKHIANAVLELPIKAVCRSFGHEPPVICTPQELLGV